MKFLLIPSILFVLFVAPLWLLLHYRNKRRAPQSLNAEERRLLEETLQELEKVSKRVETLEAILDADHPGWRQPGETRSSQEDSHV